MADHYCTLCALAFLDSIKLNISHFQKVLSLRQSKIFYKILQHNSPATQADTPTISNDANKYMNKLFLEQFLSRFHYSFIENSFGKKNNKMIFHSLVSARKETVFVHQVSRLCLNLKSNTYQICFFLYKRLLRALSTPPLVILVIFRFLFEFETDWFCYFLFDYISM